MKYFLDIINDEIWNQEAFSKSARIYRRFHVNLKKFSIFPFQPVLYYQQKILHIIWKKFMNEILFSIVI